MNVIEELNIIMMQLDYILDELDVEGHPTSYKIEKMILDTQMSLNKIVDRIANAAE